MSTLTIQIAVLDAAAESLAAVADTVSLAGAGGLAAIATMAGALPGSAVQTDLPSVPIEQLATAVSAQCRQIAQRVAVGAQSYRDMEAALSEGITSAGATVPVPQ
ncbi:MAG: hypothetical protein WKF47_03450 [Geodermatophilaceae bacterium]